MGKFLKKERGRQFLRALNAVMRWGRLEPPAPIEMRLFRGWILIIDSTLQTSVFLALLLAYVLAFQAGLGRGTNSFVQRFWFPNELSLLCIAVAAASDFVQDALGHFVITEMLECHYTRHFAGSWVAVFRLVAAAYGGLLGLTTIVLVAKLAEDAQAGIFA